LLICRPLPLDQWQAHLAQENISIEQGQVHRTGAMGPIISLYLIEISNRLEG